MIALVLALAMQTAPMPFHFPTVPGLAQIGYADYCYAYDTAFDPRNVLKCHYPKYGMMEQPLELDRTWEPLNPVVEIAQPGPNSAMAVFMPTLPAHQTLTVIDGYDWNEITHPLLTCSLDNEGIVSGCVLREGVTLDEVMQQMYKAIVNAQNNGMAAYNELKAQVDLYLKSIHDIYHPAKSRKKASQ